MQNQKDSSVQRQVFLVLGFLLGIFIIAQFVVLDFAGIHGPEITKLKAEQENLKIQNELKKSRINELTKSQDIQSFAENNLGMVTTNVNNVQPSDTSITAINY